MKVFRHIFALILITSLGMNIACVESNTDKATEAEKSGIEATSIKGNSIKGNSIFYLVRHAEKLKDGTNDPHLI